MLAALLQCRQASGTGLHWIAESAIRAIDGVEGASDRRGAVATASRWRVRRGRMLADNELQDTQTAVPRPAAGAQPAPASHSGCGSMSTEFSRRGVFG